MWRIHLPHKILLNQGPSWLDKPIQVVFEGNQYALPIVRENVLRDLRQGRKQTSIHLPDFANPNNMIQFTLRLEINYEPPSVTVERVDVRKLHIMNEDESRVVVAEEEEEPKSDLLEIPQKFYDAL